MSEGAGFVPVKTMLQYQSPLLRLSAGNAVRLLGYQSSLLRLCADAAPGPWFQYQRFLLRFWAGAYELVARNYENGLAFFNPAIEQRTSGKPRPNSSASEPDHDPKPVVEQMSDMAAETAGTLAKTRTVAADQLKPAATKQEATGANARKKIPAASARKKIQAASARKKIAKKASKKAVRK
jgi:hypothetical protein